MPTEPVQVPNQIAIAKKRGVVKVLVSDTLNLTKLTVKNLFKYAGKLPFDLFFILISPLIMPTAWWFSSFSTLWPVNPLTGKKERMSGRTRFFCEVKHFKNQVIRKISNYIKSVNARANESVK